MTSCQASLGQALADAIYSCTYQVCFLPAVGTKADGATICRVTAGSHSFKQASWFHWQIVGENGIEMGDVTNYDMIRYGDIKLRDIT